MANQLAHARRESMDLHMLTGAQMAYAVVSLVVIAVRGEKGKGVAKYLKHVLHVVIRVQPRL